MHHVWLFDPGYEGLGPHGRFAGELSTQKTLRFSVVLRTGSWTENTASLYLLLVSMAVTAMLAFLWCELMPQVFWNEIPVTNRVKNPRSKADKLGLCSDLQEAFQATVIFGERVSMQSWSTTIAVLEVVFALGFCLVMLQLKAETSANIYICTYIHIYGYRMIIFCTFDHCKTSISIYTQILWQ